MIAGHSKASHAYGLIARHRLHCAACGSRLGDEWSDILVGIGRLYAMASVCNRCAARAGVSPQGYADVVADVKWRAGNE